MTFQRNREKIHGTNLLRPIKHSAFISTVTAANDDVDVNTIASSLDWVQRQQERIFSVCLSVSHSSIDLCECKIVFRYRSVGAKYDFLQEWPVMETGTRHGNYFNSIGSPRISERQDTKDLQTTSNRQFMMKTKNIRWRTNSRQHRQIVRLRTVDGGKNAKQHPEQLGMACLTFFCASLLLVHAASYITRRFWLLSGDV